MQKHPHSHNLNLLWHQNRITSSCIEGPTPPYSVFIIQIQGVNSGYLDCTGRASQPSICSSLIFRLLTSIPNLYTGFYTILTTVYYGTYYPCLYWYIICPIFTINCPNCNAYLFYTMSQSTYVFTLGISNISKISLITVLSLDAVCLYCYNVSY